MPCSRDALDIYYDASRYVKRAGNDTISESKVNNIDMHRAICFMDNSLFFKNNKSLEL